jgi:hypothetical protein
MKIKYINCTPKLCNILCKDQNWEKIISLTQMVIEIVTLFDWY